MPRTYPLRGTFHTAAWPALVFAFTASIYGQNLPPTPPTSAQGQPGSATSQAVVPPPNPAVHAEVSYTGGMLQVRADNSSLNQILRSVSHVTGMRITGGVEEQRVFGNYGPAPLSTVLATLLDGTESNILLLGGSQGAPPELVLTPRNGGAPPPGPNSPAYAMYDDANDRANRVGPPGAPSNGGTTVIQTPSPAAAASAPPANAAPRVLTPEMVEQELIEMQKKKQAGTATPPPAAPSNPH